MANRGGLAQMLDTRQPPRSPRADQGTVRIAPRPWRLFVPPLGWLLLILLIPLIPPSQRHANPVAVIACIVGCTVLMELICFAVWRPRRNDVLIADAEGVRITSQRRGDRTLPWGDIASLGWMPPGFRDVGVVARLRSDGQGSPVWLCNPVGQVLPRSAKRLRSLAESHGVRWEKFGPMDVGNQSAT